jgi:hypothetical protein
MNHRKTVITAVTVATLISLLAVISYGANRRPLS